MNKVIVISAVWCPSCLILNKNLKKLQEEYKNINIKKYDYDFDEDEIKKYNIGDKLPVLIIEDENSIEKGRLVGEKTYEEIKNFIEGMK